MSDIQLNKLHRARPARAGYAPLDPENGHASAAPPNRMPRSAQVAAVSAARKNGPRMRRQERYADDPEEEAGLLQEEQDGGFPDDERREVEELPQVCLAAYWRTELWLKLQ